MRRDRDVQPRRGVCSLEAPRYFIPRTCRSFQRFAGDFVGKNLLCLVECDVTIAIPHSIASNLVEERRRCPLRGISGHGCARVRIVWASTAGHDDTAKSMDSLILRAAPVRMLARVCAPAQTPYVEVLPVAEEVPTLHDAAVGYLSEPKAVMCARTAGSGYARCIRRRALPFRATQVKISCSSLCA